MKDYQTKWLEQKESGEHQRIQKILSKYNSVGEGEPVGRQKRQKEQVLI
jgi:hypothetical protein